MLKKELKEVISWTTENILLLWKNNNLYVLLLQIYFNIYIAMPPPHFTNLFTEIKLAFMIFMSSDSYEITVNIDYVVHLYLSRPVFSNLAGVIRWRKLLLKVMHYNIALLHKKVTNCVTFYGNFFFQINQKV